MVEFIFDEFTWRRPGGRKRGFAWEGDGDARRLVRVPEVAFVDYRPRPELFRDFADLDGSEGAVLRFANAYGRLGPETDPSMDYLGFWQGPIALMRESVGLADALDSGDGKKIKAALGDLTEEDLQAIAERRQTPVGRVSSLGITPGEFAHAALARLGRYLLARRVLFSHLSLAGDLDPRTGRVQARFGHEHLLGFMFFQFALSLIEGRKFRRCDGCGRWFRLAPGVGRADKTACSPSCRFQQYRRRRRRAVELHGAGWTPKRIAEEVGSTVAKVREWISSQRKG
jgi:hypothetical protein